MGHKPGAQDFLEGWVMGLKKKLLVGSLSAGIVFLLIVLVRRWLDKCRGGTLRIK